MAETIKVPQYLSAPINVIWMEIDEFSVLFGGFILWYMYPSFILAGIALLITFVYSKAKKLYPRGFLKHCLYFTGFLEVLGYPSFFQNHFVE